MIGASGWMIFIVTAALAGLAHLKVKGAYEKWSQVPTRSGITGAEIARQMMRDNNIHDVEMEIVAGEMTDHYDPRAKVVRLSEAVYHGKSVAALGIAAHEVGHVIQHAEGYGPLKMRSVMYPAASIGNNIGPLLVIAGLFIAALQPLAWVGVWLFAAATLFTVVTLPVEFDASRRALMALDNGMTMEQDEHNGARSVLNAAALTYVAAAITSVLWLMHYVSILNSRD